MSQALLDFMTRHHVRTKTGPGHRWKEGDVINSAHDARMNAYTLQFSGDHFLQLDAFSYSFSYLTPFTKTGRYCSISWNTGMMGLQHAMEYVSTASLLSDGFFSDSFAQFGATGWKRLPKPEERHTTIGHDVWIGQNVLIKPGVAIGTGSVIAAGSIVTKDVQPYEIVGGIPAKRIRMRFPDQIAAELLALEWWKYAIPQLPHLPWHDPSSFVPALRDAIAEGEVVAYASDLGAVRDIVEDKS